MSEKEAKWDLMKWKMIQRRLGYSDEEMKTYRGNPKNEQILNRTPCFKTNGLWFGLSNPAIVILSIKWAMLFIWKQPVICSPKSARKISVSMH